MNAPTRHNHTKTPPRGAAMQRVLVVLALAVIFFAIGLLLAGAALERDVLLERTVYFQPQNTPAQGFTDWWPDVSARQQARLRQLARLHVPDVVQYLDVEAARTAPAIQVQLRCPRPLEPVALERLQVLLGAYLTQIDAPTPALDAHPADLARNPDLTRFSKSFVLSGLQKIVAGAFALAGLLLGLAWPLGPAASTRPPLPTTPDDYRRWVAQEQEKPQQEDEPDIPLDEPPESVQEPPAEEEPLESQGIPIIAIDLNKDEPGTGVGAGSGWQAKYDRLARLIADLRQEAGNCPAVLVGDEMKKECSPRFVVNLAISLTRRRLRVLLVAAEAGVGEVEELFDLADRPGFYEWRRGDAWVSQAAKDTPLVGLTVMGAGNPSQAQLDTELDLAHETHRWNNLSNTFDVVLLYAPGALAHDARAELVHLQSLATACVAMTRQQRHAQTLRDQLARRLAGSETTLVAMVVLSS